MTPHRVATLNSGTALQLHSGRFHRLSGTDLVGRQIPALPHFPGPPLTSGEYGERHE